ncbi:MAG: DUF3426 domain-containing protein [Rhodanobacteraceae bacterium]|nr:MAG: DUF3426 domain-containing protein [Rhodanobacteraceae bacterium]
MYTQCPQCLTIYEIDEDALQASLGIVRCGYCAGRFDALRTLSDTLPASPDAALPEHTAEELTPTLTEAISPDVIEAAARRQRRRPDVAAPPARDAPAFEDTPAAPTDDPWFAPLSGERTQALIADAAGLPPEAIQGDPAWQAIDLPVQARFPELDIIPMAPGPAAGGAGETLSATGESIIEPVEPGPFTEPWSLDIPDAGTVEPELPTEQPRPDIVVHPHDADYLDAAAGAWIETDPGPAFQESGPKPGLPDAGLLADQPPPAESVTDGSDAGGRIEPDEPREGLSITDTARTESEPGNPAAPEPVYVPPRRRSIHRGDWSWALGCLLLVLVLVAQIAWAQRATLIRDPATQAWALHVCANLDCRLPPIRDVAKLELLSRDIRPDPNTAGALTITATVRNGAAFRQPWPVVVVELTDLDNDVVAMRRFRPAEYMPDPARRTDGLAPGTTAAVAFEVADPGKRAVSFRFGFE